MWKVLKTKKLEIYLKKKPKKRCNKIQDCRGQNHAGEVSKFKFRCLSLICAVLHLSSISGRSSKQKNSKSVKGVVMIMTIFGARSVGLSCVAPFETQNTNLETSYEG